MGFSLFKYFSGKEKWPLLLEALEYRISKKIPDHLRIKKAFIQRMQSAGIPLLKRDNGIIVDYEIQGKKNELFLRDNSSDISVFSQIILGNEYKPVIELFKKLNLPIKHFIDAGANIGFSSIYLSAVYPDAKFICLEPHPGIFAALKNNITQNIKADKYTLIQKALWNKPALLSGDNSFRDGKDWSFSVKEAGKLTGDIEGITMDMLINEYDFNEIDFLKIDIEGAEAQLFDNIEYLRSWTDKIKVMSIEIHDETNARFKIENTLQNLGFRLYNSGEITIAVNKKIISPLLYDE